jgi:hypothetical protein
MAKPHWIINIHFKNGGEEHKIDPVKEWVQMGGWGWIWRVKEDEYGQCTLYTHENRTMKPVEILLRLISFKWQVMRKKNGQSEPSQGTLWTGMEMSQWTHTHTSLIYENKNVF